MPEPHPEGYCPVFGNYPKEYNRKIHGPYYPWVDYRPTRDIQFKDVKLGELQAWIMRRDKTPQAAIAAMSRAYSKWHHTWFGSKFGSPSKGFFQSIFWYSTVSMFSCYGLVKQHRNHKYHW